MDQFRNNELSDTDQNTHLIKRRKRLSLTCSSCRSRKVKCNQGRPCNNCVKKKIERFCIYDTTPFLPDADKAQSSQEALQILKAENALLKEQLEEALKNTTKSTNTASSSASLAFLVNDGADEFGRDYQIKNKGIVVIKKDRLLYYGGTSWRSLLAHDVRHRDTLENAKSFVSNTRREWKVERDFKNIPCSLYYDAEGSSPEQCLTNLSKYLPSYDVIRNHLDYYLKSFYFEDIPIIDANTLIRDFLSIFTKSDKEPGKCGFSVSNKTIDYARIALVLAVFKLTTISLSLAIPDYSYDSKDVLIRFCDRLLGFARNTISASIPGLQTLILLHQIKRLSAVDGDGGDGSNGVLTLRLAIGTAVAIGLHKDIDRLYYSEPPYIRLQMKRIWKFLVKEDTSLSVKVGVPFGIDDYYSDSGCFSIESTDDQLALLARKIIRISTKGDGFSKNELLKAIKEMEKFNNSEISRLSKDISKLNSEENILSSFSQISSIKEKIFYIYTLHSIYEFLYNNCQSDDPMRQYFFNSTLRYAGLCLTHVIELSLRFNKFCHTISLRNLESVNKGVLNTDGKINPEAFDLLKIVDISCVLNGMSNVIFTKAFTGICTYEIYKLSELEELRPQKGQKQSISETSKIDANDTTNESLHVNVSEIELSNPANMNETLNKSFNDPFFLHSMLTLACKHMLSLQRDSYGHVFSYHFTLFAIISLYKHFDSYIKSKEKGAVANHKTPKTKVSYDPEQDFRFRPGSSENTCSSVFSKIKSFQPNQEGFAQPCVTDAAGLSSAPLTGSQVNPLDNFDFFDWRNDEIDEMFNNILMDSKLLTYPASDPSISSPYKSSPIASVMEQNSLISTIPVTPGSLSLINSTIPQFNNTGVRNDLSTSSIISNIPSISNSNPSTDTTAPSEPLSITPLPSNLLDTPFTNQQAPLAPQIGFWGSNNSGTTSPFQLPFTPPNLNNLNNVSVVHNSTVGLAGESNLRDSGVVFKNSQQNIENVRK